MKFDFDIIGVSETWDNDNKPLAKPSICGYHPLEAKAGNSQNAGVGLFIKDTLDYRERKDLTFSSSGKNCAFECLFIEINCKIIVGVVYRHPNSNIQNFTDEFEKRVLEKTKNENKRIVIMGDYNINLMNCESHRHTSNFFDKMISFNFLPYIVQPTRFNENSHTLIDNIFYNEISDECVSGNLIPHITDHLPNFLFIPCLMLQALKILKKYQKGTFLILTFCSLERTFQILISQENSHK